MIFDGHSSASIGRITLMPSSPDPEPDRSGVILYVGQDHAGHWLVQDNAMRLEGRFTSYAAAMSFAQAERQIYRAAVQTAAGPLVSAISFSPAAADERALPHAA